jgi:hypothetical protein
MDGSVKELLDQKYKEVFRLAKEELLLLVTYYIQFICKDFTKEILWVLATSEEEEE